MPTRNAIYHRSKNVSIFPIEGDRFLITASLRDEVHDVRAEVEILHPSLEIVAARSEVGLQHGHPESTRSIHGAHAPAGFGSLGPAAGCCSDRQ